MSAKIPPGWGFDAATASLPRTNPRAKRGRLAGYRTKEIAYWLGTRRDVPSVAEIAERWGVTRQTASRYHTFALDQLRIYNGGVA